MIISDNELYWLAGLIEGEGYFGLSFNSMPIIKLGMTDQDIILKAYKLFGCGTMCKVSSSNPKWKDHWLIRVYSKDALYWMDILYPLMGNRRKLAIEYVIRQTKWTSPRNKINRSIAEHIRLLWNTTDMSQREIAKQYDIRPQTVSQIVRGITWKAVRTS